MDDETQQSVKGQQSVEGQPHIPSQQAAENLPRGAMVIPVPTEEDEPSNDDVDTEEEEAIVAMMPHQWKKTLEVKNTSMSCTSKEVSYSMVVPPMW